jgi:D-serine dehydratase
VSPVLQPLEAIDEVMVDGTVKGLPPGLGATRLGDLGRLGWNVLRRDTSFPVALLRDTVVEANRRWMRDFLAAAGVSICPHGKTTMAPQLFELQLAGGAWGLTAANATHVAVYRRFGVGRILLANQVVHEEAVAFLLDELRRDPAFELFWLVDSAATLRLLLDGLRRHQVGRPLDLLLEIGMAGGRTGARTDAEAMELARAIRAAAPAVSLRGVEAFEGVVDVTSDDGRRRADQQLDALLEVARHCEREDLFGPGEVLLTAGGSAYFDEAARRLGGPGLGRPTRVVLRCGCYLSHDAGFYRRAFARLRERSPAAAALDGGLTPALEVWAQVQARPEPDLAIVTLGKRDVSHDLGLPVPIRVFRPGLDASPREATGIGETVALWDQHAGLRLAPEATLEVGDLVAFGISHPCTTFDRWSVVLRVDEGYTVTGAVKTFF